MWLNLKLHCCFMVLLKIVMIIKKTGLLLMKLRKKVLYCCIICCSNKGIHQPSKHLVGTTVAQFTFKIYLLYIPELFLQIWYCILISFPWFNYSMMYSKCFMYSKYDQKGKQNKLICGIQRNIIEILQISLKYKTIYKTIYKYQRF